jgi:putative intracellular protease/amidase
MKTHPIRRYAVKHLTLFVILLSCVVGIISFAEAQEKGKVLVILREGESQDLEFLFTEEVAVMRKKIEEAGYETVVASVSGKPYAAKETTIEPDLKVGDVNVDDYAGVMVPCLAVDAAPTPEAMAVVKEAVADGKPVAAQRGAVPILAQAGMLKGKKYALGAEPPADEAAFQGAEFMGTGVVQDGNVMTSGVCPLAAKLLAQEDGTEELTQKFIAALDSGK